MESQRLALQREMEDKMRMAKDEVSINLSTIQYHCDMINFITIDNPYLIVEGELWGVYCEYKLRQSLYRIINDMYVLQALSHARKEAEAIQDTERDKLAAVMEEKKELEKILAAERAKASMKSQEAIDLERAQRNEIRMQQEILK